MRTLITNANTLQHFGSFIVTFLELQRVIDDSSRYFVDRKFAFTAFTCKLSIRRCFAATANNSTCFLKARPHRDTTLEIRDINIETSTADHDTTITTNIITSYIQ